MQKVHIGRVSTQPDDFFLVIAEYMILQDLNNYFVAQYGPMETQLIKQA